LAASRQGVLSTAHVEGSPDLVGKARLGDLEAPPVEGHLGLQHLEALLHLGNPQVHPQYVLYRFAPGVLEAHLGQPLSVADTHQQVLGAAGVGLLGLAVGLGLGLVGSSDAHVGAVGKGLGEGLGQS
jgi:hypothetical protein